MRVNALPEEVLDEDILFKTLEKVRHISVQKVDHD